MNQNQNKPAWMDDELVRSIPQTKLNFLGKMFQDTQGKTIGKSPKEMMTILMPMMARAKQENLSFTPQEMTACIAAIKKHSSEEERKQIDNVMNKIK
ncbi:MAG: hypothetical protein E7286_10515 [Lachnospiraceae bacterium]|nr:hypothetical protein [Lachnospiraceae bacterium]